MPIFRSENDIYPPPLLKMIFLPLSGDIVFTPIVAFLLYSSLFCFYFTLLLPFSHFLSPFFLFPSPSPFFLFLLHFSAVSLPLFKFSPQMTLADIRGGGGAVSNIIDPCLHDVLPLNETEKRIFGSSSSLQGFLMEGSG